MNRTAKEKRVKGGGQNDTKKVQNTKRSPIVKRYMTYVDLSERRKEVFYTTRECRWGKPPSMRGGYLSRSKDPKGLDVLTNQKHKRSRRRRTQKRSHRLKSSVETERQLGSDRQGIGFPRD